MISLNHKGKSFVNINDEVKSPINVAKTISLNHKDKSFINITDEVKNPTYEIKTIG